MARTAVRRSLLLLGDQPASSLSWETLLFHLGFLKAKKMRQRLLISTLQCASVPVPLWDCLESAATSGAGGRGQQPAPSLGQAPTRPCSDLFLSQPP